MKAEKKGEKKIQMKTAIKGFIGVLAAFAISALSPVLIPFALDNEGNLNAAGYAAGVMFWAGILAGTVGYILIRRMENQKIKAEIQKRKLPSALNFFSNFPAAVMDIIMIIGVIGTIYCAVNITVSQAVAVLFLVFALAGIYSHFLLNGKLFLYTWDIIQKNLKKGRKESYEK